MAAPTLQRSEAERISIGHLRSGQDFFRLSSGKLKHQGTVVAVRPGSSGGYELALTRDGKAVTTWGGAATMFYVAKQATSHTEAFAALHEERQAERAAQAKAQADARAEADIERLAKKASSTTDGAEPQEGDAKAMASTKQTSTTQTTEATEPQVDLFQLVLDGLKAEGIKATVRWSPTKKYASLIVKDGNLGYLFPATRSGVKVKAGVTLKELGSAKKGWQDISKESKVYAALRFAATEAEVASIVAALKLASTKLAEASKAQAEAKKAKAAAAKKAAAKKEPVEATEPAAEPVAATEAA